ncbi:MAG TPA: hypothetical protein VIO56_06670 [Methylotenera sp.]
MSDVASSLKSAIAFSSIDWSSTKHLAWIYGIVVGWEGDSLNELINVHNWDENTISRLNKLHAEFNMLDVDFIDEMYCLKVDVGDKIIIHSERVLSPEQKDGILKLVEAEFKNNKCLVIDGGLRFGLIKA